MLVCMEQMLCLLRKRLVKVLGIDVLDSRILMRESQGHVLILIVENIGSLLLKAESVVNRLSAAAYAAARQAITSTN